MLPLHRKLDLDQQISNLEKFDHLTEHRTSSFVERIIDIVAV
jgi:hypothetical protein